MTCACTFFFLHSSLEAFSWPDILDTFHGTLPNIKFINFVGNAGSLPLLLPDQGRKLKQLSVLTLADTNKVSYLLIHAPFKILIFPAKFIA